MIVRDRVPVRVSALLMLGAMLLPSQSLAQQTMSFGDFFLSKQHNPYSGAPEDLLFTISVEQSTAQGVIGWSCHPDLGGLSVSLVFGKYLSGGEVDLVARFDDDPPLEVVGCPISGDHQGAVLHLHQVHAFTEAARRGRHLEIEVRPPSGATALTYTFSLNGLTRGLRELACGGVGR